MWGIVWIVLMNLFSWQCQNLCWLSLAFINDWRVVVCSPVLPCTKTSILSVLNCALMCRLQMIKVTLTFGKSYMAKKILSSSFWMFLLFEPFLCLSVGRVCVFLGNPIYLSHMQHTSCLLQLTAVLFDEADKFGWWNVRPCYANISRSLALLLSGLLIR